MTLEMIDMFSYTNQECKLENKGVRKSTKMTFHVTFDHPSYKLIQKFVLCYSYSTSI